MKVFYTERFRRSYKEVPIEVRQAFDKQVLFLLQNIRHSSLKAKKYGVSGDVWQARVNRSWRFYFTIRGDIYHILDISPHPK
ncbi:MAG: hypothetical protein WAP55_01625 [Minisyncoccia bacterium]